MLWWSVAGAAPRLVRPKTERSEDEGVGGGWLVDVDVARLLMRLVRWLAVGGRQSAVEVDG